MAKDTHADVPEKLTEEMQQSRERLRKKKPKVWAKLMQYLEKEKSGEPSAMSLLDWAYGFECNFACPHCCADTFRKMKSKEKLTLDQISNMADQVDDVGIFVINMIGGEPLYWKRFDEILTALDPSRFHISITTNGWLLTRKRADALAQAQVDKIGVSIDSGFEEEHDRFRCKPGSFKKAVGAVKNAKDAGIRTMISTVVTHQNIRSAGFKELIRLSESLGVTLDLQCATVSGGWRNNLDVLIDQKDADDLESLRERYPLLRRDVWSVPGSIGGCPAATRSFYIIPSGDVLPCLFIHVSFGNIQTEPLSLIHQRMLNVQEFASFSNLCLAGEDRRFINEYLSKTFETDHLPIDYRDVFRL